MKRTTGKIQSVEKTWLSREEAMAYLGCSDDFLKTLRDKAEVSYARFGRMVWYDLKSLEQFVSDHRVV